VTGFTTWMPDYGKDLSERTVAYYAYDAENLYFAFRAYDREPSKIKASMANRDNIRPDDWICLNLDSFNDQQGLYSFYVNPLGIQMDSRFAGNKEDFGFDAVWYSAGRIDEQGYTTEVRIPFKSLRYNGRDPVMMGVVFERYISRKTEDGTVPALDPKMGFNFVLQTAPMELRDVKHYTLLEVLPAATYSRQQATDAGQLAVLSSGGDLGVTAKYGLTPQLMADGTYNPDFSQVESDAGQVDFNRRYALYFREKRSFFQEGNEIFNFAAAAEESYFAAAVHTRTIIDPFFGFKLNGKLGSANSVAAIFARDDVSNGDGGPNPTFSILRVKHALKDDSYIGGFYTARDQGEGFNRVVGADGRFRLSASSVAEFHVFGSFSRPAEGGDRADGFTGALRYSYGNRNVNVELIYEEISPNFQVDTGFLMRTGIRNFTHFVNYIFYPKSNFFLSIEPFYYGVQQYDTAYHMFETINVLALRINLPRSSQFRLDAILGNEQFLGRLFDRNAWRVQGWTQITKKIFFHAMFRRGGAIFYDEDDPYQGYSNQSSAMLQYQPTEKLDLELDLTYVDFFRQSDHSQVYDYAIVRGRSTFQLNEYLFLRGIAEYNNFRKRLTLDVLLSFTYIPGTVVFVGYGSAQEKLRWDGLDYVDSNRFREMQRGFFFKVSYLWRL